ncbi:uncharacterized protein AMSG_12116 [Thecamonas trahens ATCC 50062]|uniref:BHLH domain-containing protein n=1 Tax=Thecamonas trahens ATCC 50062 TaxID=461836 RepID=A0A0L0DHZ4_THETB|nr:hypothetical protein AMSG_12116 [Thecamonas trahens ATCC 50062]KNC51850.1 hypothetical protein AMSG_12116 [Thecamonas trahens ATCC 50062]|eukprot:XP_013755774.1 hypothetical protein AMSG_12116 [Thecamonas trahens ATCC 50062]
MSLQAHSRKRKSSSSTRRAGRTNHSGSGSKGGTEQQRLRSKKLRAQMKELFNTLGSVLGLHPKETVKVIVSTAIDTVEEQSSRIKELESALAAANARIERLGGGSAADSITLDSLRMDPSTNMLGMAGGVGSVSGVGGERTTPYASVSPEPCSPTTPHSLASTTSVDRAMSSGKGSTPPTHAAADRSLAPMGAASPTSPPSSSTVNPQQVFSSFSLPMDIPGFQLQMDESGLRVGAATETKPGAAATSYTPEQILELHKLHSLHQLQRLQLLQHQMQVQQQYELAQKMKAKQAASVPAGDPTGGGRNESAAGADGSLSVKERLSRRRRRRHSRSQSRSGVSTPSVSISASLSEGSWSDSLAGVFSSSISASLSRSDEEDNDGYSYYSYGESSADEGGADGHSKPTGSLDETGPSITAKSSSGAASTARVSHTSRKSSRSKSHRALPKLPPHAAAAAAAINSGFVAEVKSKSKA